MLKVFRNLWYMVRRFKSAYALNLLGLSLAFASFFVIMTQVNYDLGYNKNFAAHENLFRLTMKLGAGMEDYGITLPRPLVERLAVASPHVTGYGVTQGWTNYDQFLLGEQEYSLNLVYGIHNFVGVYKPTVIDGNLKGLNHWPISCCPARRPCVSSVQPMPWAKP